MYEFTPQRSNRTAINVSSSLFIIGVLAMFATNIPNLPYRWIMQLVTICLFVAALTIMGRFIFKSYTYAIITNGECSADLTVTEIKRKSRITVCRISLSGIEKVIVATSDKSDAEANSSRGRKIYNYCVDMSPKQYICIFAEECGEKLVIKLSFDQKLLDMITPADQTSSDNIL
jgi:hypothetical protein